MESSIDLHGIPHDEAILEVEDFLLKTSIEIGGTVSVITGNSYRLQNRIKEEILDPYDFKYYIPTNNLGVIKVVHEEL